MQVSEADIEWVAVHFPELSHWSEDATHTFQGILSFEGTFNFALREYSFYFGEQPLDTVTRGSYQVRITVSTNDAPIIREIGGRIPAIADRHKYAHSNIVCAWGPLDCPRDTDNLQHLFLIALQYFFDQSYFDLHGVWPRGEFYHGSLGIVQNYHHASSKNASVGDECVALLRRMPDWQMYRRKLFRIGRLKNFEKCICGSGRRYWRCHREVYLGLVELQKHCAETR